MNHTDEDRTWRELVSAGQVPEPTEDTLAEARRYLRPHVQGLGTGNAEARSRRRASFALTAVAIAASLAIFGVVANTLNRSNYSPEPTPSEVAAPDPAPTAPFILNTGGRASLIRPFFLPTVKEFARDPIVDQVITGTITGAISGVTPGSGGEVRTRLTVDVDQRRQPGESTVEVLETGGTVAAREIKRQLETELGRSLATSELDDLVEYRVDGRKPAQVGDRVLLILGRPDAGSHTAPVLARLNATDGGKDFVWAGKPPNNEWDLRIDTDEVSAILQPLESR